MYSTHCTIRPKYTGMDEYLRLNGIINNTKSNKKIYDDLRIPDIFI